MYVPNEMLLNYDDGEKFEMIFEPSDNCSKHRTSDNKNTHNLYLITYQQDKGLVEQYQVRKNDPKYILHIDFHSIFRSEHYTFCLDMEIAQQISFGQDNNAREDITHVDRVLLQDNSFPWDNECSSLVHKDQSCLNTFQEDKDILLEMLCLSMEIHRKN